MARFGVAYKRRTSATAGRCYRNGLFIGRWNVLACCVFTLAALLAAAPEAPREPLDIVITREAQAAFEVLGVSWSAVPEVDRRRWAVVRIAPSEFSGASFVSLEKNEAGVGDREPKIKPGKYIRLVGEWEATSFWGGASEPRKGRGTYDWLLPMPSPFNWRIHPPSLFSVCAERPGGFIGARLSVDGPDAKGKPTSVSHAGRPWDEAASLPMGWETDLPNAWKQEKEFKLVISENPGKESLDALRGLALSENPVIAVLAFQRLLASHAVDLDYSKEMLKRSRGSKRVLLVYLLGRNLESVGGGAMTDVVVSFCAEAKSADELRVWCAGGLAAANFADLQSPQREFGDRVIRRVNQRVLELKLDAEVVEEFGAALPIPRNTE